MTFPIDTPSFRLYQPGGPRGESTQNRATRLTTVGLGKLTVDTSASGNIDAGHPIDQGVVLSLTVRLGSIKSSPSVGNRIHEVDPASKSIENDVRQRVLEAYPLSRYLADRSVTITRIDHEVRAHGGLLVSVSYKNNLLARGTERTVSTP